MSWIDSRASHLQPLDERLIDARGRLSFDVIKILRDSARQRRSVNSLTCLGQFVNDR